MYLQELAPIQLNRAWLYRFNFEDSLTTEINRHLQVLWEKHKVPFPCDIANQLSDPGFWQAHPQTIGLKKLEKKWQTYRGFYHLSTTQLLWMLQTQLEPLQFYLALSINFIKEDMQRWKPYFIRRIQNEKLKILNTKNQFIMQYQTTLLKVLHQRMAPPAPLAQFSQLDDDVWWMIQQLRTHDIHLPYENPRTGLSDDDRIVFHDWLTTHHKRCRDIIKPIQQVGYLPPKYKGLRLSNRIHVLEEALGINTHHRTKPTEYPPSIVQKLLYFISHPLKQSASLLYKLRYVIGLVVSMCFYLWFAPLVMAQLSFVLSEPLMSMANALLFYGLGLAPIWLWGYQWLKSGLSALGQGVLEDKNADILLAAQHLKQAQSLSRRLEVGILDTPNYAVDQLIIEAENLQQSLNNHLQVLNNTTLLQQWMMSTKTKHNIQRTLKLCKHAHQHLHRGLRQFATHINQRLSQAVNQLVCDVHQGVHPSLSPEQVQRYRQFIKCFGDKTTQQALNNTLNLGHRFVHALTKQVLTCNHHNPNPLTPWGQKKPLPEAFKGWHCLLKYQGQDKTQLIRLVEKLSQNQLNAQAIAEVSQHYPDLKPALENYIYECLASLPVTWVHFLSKPQKQNIQNWYQVYQPLIREAQSILNGLIQHHDVRVLQNLSEQDAAIMMSMLDGAALAYELNGKPMENQIRKAMKTYDGSYAEIYVLIRFFPWYERREHLKNIAYNRLNWLLNYPQYAHFSHFDVALFLDRNLVDFDLKMLVKQHILKHPAQPGLEQLVTSLMPHGLMDCTMQELLAKTPATAQPKKMRTAIRVY